jgi:hypothetical protein
MKRFILFGREQIHASSIHSGYHLEVLAHLRVNVYPSKREKPARQTLVLRFGFLKTKGTAANPAK